MYVTDCLFKANSPTPNGIREIVREPPDHTTGNEPKPDIAIGDAGPGIKKHINDKYISFETNIFIMYHLHLLSTETEDKNRSIGPELTTSKTGPIHLSSLVEIAFVD